MSRTHIPVTLRQFVIERARHRCEYFLVHEDDVLLPHSIDHIIAEQHGGTTTADNLALACLHCHRPKGPNIASIDVETATIVSLFHPRQNDWEEHFQLGKGHIVPQTATGRVTVRLLKLNEIERVRVRQFLIVVGRYP